MQALDWVRIFSKTKCTVPIYPPKSYNSVYTVVPSVHAYYAVCVCDSVSPSVVSNLIFRICIVV